MYLPKIWAGNDPCSATVLDPQTTEYETFDLSGYTESGVEPPPYGDYSSPDIWFSFTVPIGNLIYLIIDEGTLTNPAIAVYEGPCDDPKLIFNIIDNNCDGSPSPLVVFSKLDEGEEYFIRLWAQDGTPVGDFDIFLSSTEGETTEFILSGDATFSEDCIILTEDVDHQHGCAWFEFPIDFSEPFTHEMSVNFGDQDSNGADGICLIYQANGPDYCGDSGEGIGAQGMPNSAIFEFDTWQNNNLNDPFNDHSSFNINGDMNHSNSINGPVDLGNIEDGDDHSITFNYDGAGGYELYFDGTLILSGNFDFINDCFGGSNNVWWGYTAATGGSNNNQIMCPYTEDFILGTQEYEEIEICEGESYEGYTETGFYVYYEPMDVDCQHQINLNLIVHPHGESFFEEEICEGEVFTLNGENFDQTGSYDMFLTTTFGCDSTIHLDLTVHPDEEIFLEEDICEGEVFTLNGENFDQTGSYDMILMTTFGCDSTIHLDLTVHPDEEIFLEEDICEGEVFTLNGENFDQTGSYDMILMTTFGCDSTIHLDLTVHPDSESFFEEEICEGEVVTFNGENFDESGSYDISTLTTFGCDSTIHLDLLVHPVEEIFLEEDICEGEVFTLNGEDFDQTGSYDMILMTTFGCDSTIHLDLTVHPVEEIFLEEHICEGEVFTLNGENFDQTGSYDMFLTTTFGCDSTIHLDLTVHPEGESFFEEEICEGEVVTFNGENFGESGSYDISTLTTFGCDSTIHLDLTVHPEGESFFEEEICEGDFVTFNGETFDESGSYDILTLTTFGCDSTIHLDLTVHPNGESFFEEEICEGEFVTFNGETFDESGSYEFHYLTTFGCDSLVVLDLIVHPEGESFFEEEICEGEVFTLNGQTFDESGSYDMHTFTEFGCDSTIHLDLNVHQTGYSYFEEVICEGEYIFLNGEIYDESGSYDILTLTTYDCDSLIHLDLTVNPASYSYFEEMICEGEVFTFSGQTFDYPGYYEMYYVNSFGCDSVVQLDLAVPDIDYEITSSGNLNCTNADVELSFEFTSDTDYDDITFSWFTPNEDQTGQVITAYEPGWYYATATIGFGDLECEMEAEFYLDIDFDSPVLTLPDTMMLGCSDFESPVILEPDVSDGNMAYEWYLNSIFIGTDSFLIIEDEGIYFLSVTNLENGCFTSAETTIIFEIDIPQIDFEPDVLNCHTDSIDLQVVIDGDISSVNWLHNDAHFSDEINPVIIEPGLYEINILAENGCELTRQINIDQDTIKPFFESDESYITCNSSSVSLNLVGDTIWEITWNGPQMIADNLFDPLVTIEGNYIATAYNPVNHCTYTDTFPVIKLGDSPILSLMADTIDCASPQIEIVNICDQNDVSFEWFHQNELISNTQNLLITQGGLYSVLAISSTGCITKDSIYVHKNEGGPELILYTDAIDCDNGIAHIYAEIENDLQITWYFNNLVISQESSFETDVPGWYFVELVDPENGCTSFDSIQVIDGSFNINYDLSHDTISCNQPEMIIDLSVYSPFQFVEWTFPNGSKTEEERPLVNTGGNYLLHIEVDGPCDLDTIIYVEEDLLVPVFEVSHGLIDCNNPKADINISGTHSSDQIFIVSPSGNGYTDPVVSTEEPGIYQIMVTGTNGCTSEQEIEILSFTDSPEAQITASGPITCEYPVVSVELTSPEEDLQIAWTGPKDFISDAFAFNTESGGNFLAVITNSHGCTSQLQTIIEVFQEKPTLSLSGNDIDCIQDFSEMSFVSDDMLETIIWKNSSGHIISSQDKLIGEEGGWYFIEIRNQYGCSSHDSIFIEENTETPEIILLAENPIVADKNSTEEYTIPIEVISEGEYNIEWIPGEGISCDDCENPIITGNDIDHYDIHVINEYGCTAHAEVDIRYFKDIKVYVPNIITPKNKDGLNDHLSLFGNESVALIRKMEIFDRWGNLIALKRDFPPNDPTLGWDGTFNGRPVVSGVFVYVFHIETTDGELLIYSGDVTVI